MLKRVSAAWVLIAVCVMLVAYWAGRAGRRPGDGRAAPATGTAEPTDPSKPAPGAGTTAAIGPEAPSQPEPPEPVAQPGYGTGTESPGYTTQPDGTGTGTEVPWQDGTATGESSTGTPYGQGESTRWDTGQDTDHGTTTDTDYGTTTDTDYGITADKGYGTTTAAGDSYAGAQATPETVAVETATVFSLFDGFEDGNGWAVESAADHAELSLSDEHPSQGQKALRAAWKAYGKGNFELRREVKLDLTDATAFRLDVYNDGQPLDLVLGLRGGYDDALFTTPPKPIANGWNRDVTFALADLSQAQKGAWGTSWAWSRDSVSRISLIFRERDAKEGVVHVDNLRFDRPADTLGAAARPVIRTIRASAQAVDRFATLELAVDFDGTYQDFFDRSQVDIFGSFLAPSGKRYEVKGFVYDVDAAAGKPTWRIRFAPTEVGLWRYDVTVKDQGGETTSQTYQFLCRKQAQGSGFIRVSKSDPRYFEFDDGSFYYPIGQNVCWASNYEYYLDHIKAYGGNYVRIWLCPWNLQLEDPREVGKYDLQVAKALDTLLEGCRQRGIYVQLVLRYHGMQDASWEKNPYNAANGGPCTWAGDFFTDAKAKELHKRFLEYLAARWGHSTAIFAWELWNEADLARCDREADLVAWHREMAAHLKKTDAHGHLVTTSVCSPGRNTPLFELPEIDCVPVHLYTRDLARELHKAWMLYRKLHKPIFVSEFSAGIKPADDLDDTRGVRLQAGLWLAFAMPFAGNAMPWWWDTFVDKNKLYHHWVALTRFAQGLDRRGKDYELVVSQVQQGDGTAAASLVGIVAPTQAVMFVFDDARILRPEHADRPLLLAERRVRLHGMLGGAFRVAVWDTIAGKPVSDTIATASEGTLSFVLPKSDHSLAVRITSEMPVKARPRVEW